MPEQQATAGVHSRIIQVIGDGNVIGSQPYLSLRVPFRSTCAVPGAPGNEAALLGPGAEVTTFVGRQALVDSFVSWAKSHTPERPVSVRVVHGGAGVGKTRFAMELCRKLDSGWQAGFVDGTEARRFSRQTNLADWGWQAPTLVVFDYALTLLDVLPDWMDELCSIQGKPHPLRIVLLERQAGEGQGGWLERAFPRHFGIGDTCPADLLDGEPLPLPDMADFAMQRGIMQDMLTRLGSGIVLPQDDATFRDRLASTDWAGAPLYLMMAAMVMHRQGGVGEVLHLGRVDLAQAVADHELERLRRACHGEPSLEIFLPYMAALATVSGGLPGELVHDCIRREKEAIGCESLNTAIVKRVLSELLPDEGRAGIAPIRPDIVGEAFVLARLGNGQASEGERAVLRAFADRPAEVAAVLVRCVQDFAPRGADAASARETRDQERALAWLRAVGEIQNLPLSSLLILIDAIPQQTLALSTLAVNWQWRAEAILREKAANDAAPCVDLAINLNNLAVRLNEVGQHEKALPAAQEAVKIYHELADASPDAFRQDLAMCLNNLANCLCEARQLEEAITSAREAAEIYRKLADVKPNDFLPDLVMSLNNLATILSEAGQHDAALTVAEEAAKIYRKLPDVNRDVFQQNLAAFFITLSNILSESGQHKKALATAQEAANIYAYLVNTNPDTFLPYRSIILNTLSLRFGKVGQQEEALKMSQKAVMLQRKLVNINPKAFRPLLAKYLNNLTNWLNEAGQQEEALTTAREAAQIFVSLYRASPASFERNFKIAMTTWLSLRHDIPREEASSMFRQDPDAHIRALLEGGDNDTETPPNQGA